MIYLWILAGIVLMAIGVWCGKEIERVRVEREELLMDRQRLRSMREELRALKRENELLRSASKEVQP